MVNDISVILNGLKQAAQMNLYINDVHDSKYFKQRFNEAEKLFFKNYRKIISQHIIDEPALNRASIPLCVASQLIDDLIGDETTAYDSRLIEHLLSSAVNNSSEVYQKVITDSASYLRDMTQFALMFRSENVGKGVIYINALNSDIFGDTKKQIELDNFHKALELIVYRLDPEQTPGTSKEIYLETALDFLEFGRAIGLSRTSIREYEKGIREIVEYLPTPSV